MKMFVIRLLYCKDLGGGIPGAGAAYNPDGSMRYMMDGSQQFTPPGESIYSFVLTSYSCHTLPYVNERERENEREKGMRREANVSCHTM